jgi:hypothetical protein
MQSNHYTPHELVSPLFQLPSYYHHELFSTINFDVSYLREQDKQRGKWIHQPTDDTLITREGAPARSCGNNS